MASRTIADFIAATLAHAGVKRVWGVTGDSLNGFTDACGDRQDRMDACAPRGSRGLRRRRRGARPASSRFAPGVAVPAICTSSTGCSTVIAAVRRCWPSPRIFRHPKSASAISRKPIRRSCSANAAIIVELISSAGADAANVLHRAMRTAISARRRGGGNSRRRRAGRRRRQERTPRGALSQRPCIACADGSRTRPTRRAAQRRAQR